MRRGPDRIQCRESAVAQGGQRRLVLDLDEVESVRIGSRDHLGDDGHVLRSIPLRVPPGDVDLVGTLFRFTAVPHEVGVDRHDAQARGVGGPIIGERRGYREEHQRHRSNREGVNSANLSIWHDPWSG